jgi:ketosteroid isomerase-like protein
LNPENPKATGPESAQNEPAGPNPEIEAFFQRLPANLHWPPPSEAAIAAAMEVIQRISGAEPADPPHLASTETWDRLCAGCGHALRNGTRFCGNCGLSIADSVSAGIQEHGSSAPTLSPDDVMKRAPSAAHSSGETGAGHAPAQHHYHHHYHHFVGSPGSATVSPQQESGAVVQGRASSSAAAPGSRAELAVRQVVQDWAQSCNTRHLDDLLELYSPDATLIRPDILPVRSIPAIREFLFASLEAGLGDVEMESLRTELFGEIALDLGRCKMLVPVAMGKRREERGKYLLVLARQPAGHWRIVADCWSTDLSVTTPLATAPARKPADPSAKKPR